MVLTVARILRHRRVEYHERCLFDRWRDRKAKIPEAVESHRQLERRKSQLPSSSTPIKARAEERTRMNARHRVRRLDARHHTEV